MSDTSLIERVARAISNADGDDWVREGDTSLMEVYGPHAAAALAAMPLGSRWTDAEGREVVACHPSDMTYEAYERIRSQGDPEHG